MNILAVLRMMPDPAGELVLAPDGSGLDREWLDYQLNDFDDQALEEAILLKEATGARVTAVAIGEGSQRVLQMAAARGADLAIGIDGDPDAMLSSRALAGALVPLVREHAVDLVLTGVQAAEDLFGQLAPYLGALLDWPHLSGTSRIAVDGSGLAVAQERGGGLVANYAVPLPAVLGVQTASKAPRYVSGSKLREASKTAVQRGGAIAADSDPAPKAVQLSEPTGGAGAESLGITAEQVADRLIVVLAEKGLIGARP